MTTPKLTITHAHARTAWRETFGADAEMGPEVRDYLERLGVEIEEEPEVLWSYKDWRVLSDGRISRGSDEWLPGGDSMAASLAQALAAKHRELEKAREALRVAVSEWSHGESCTSCKRIINRLREMGVEVEG